VSRVREILEVALLSIDEVLNSPTYQVDRDMEIDKVLTVLAAGVVPPSFIIPLLNSEVNDLVLVFDPRKRLLSAKSSRNPDKRAVINAILKTVSRG
jgi:hypothetical protein